MKSIQFSAIILSYARPQNIDSICSMLLSIDNISTVCLSNNNPSINISDFITTTDNRLQVISQKQSSGPFKRYTIANQLSGEYFLSIDDDLFLQQKQVEFLMNMLLDDHRAPHGFWGQNFIVNKNDILFEYGLINKNDRVDILNRCYFFTREHLSEMFRLMKCLKIDETDVGPSDDIILSFSGQVKPFSHNIGTYIDCPTSNKSGVAQWLEQDFDQRRASIIKKILQVKTLGF